MLFVQESIILYELFMRYESNAIVIEFDVTETTTVTMTRESEMKRKKKNIKIVAANERMNENGRENWNENHVR